MTMDFYGAISYNKKESFDYENVLHWYNSIISDGVKVGYDNVSLDELQLVYSPIAIARVQKTVLEALMTDKLDFNHKTWKILVDEKDVPAAAIAFRDLAQMFNNLSKLTCYSNLNVNNININNILYQKITWLSSLNISYNTILSNSVIQQNTTINSNLYISNISILNTGTILSNLYVSGFSKLDNIISSNTITSLNLLGQEYNAYNKFNNMFISSTLSVFNSCNINNLVINDLTTIYSSLYITKSSIFKDIIVTQANIIGTLYISNVFAFNLPQCNYYTDSTALSLPLWSLFITKYDNPNTNNIINQLTLRINRIPPTLNLINETGTPSKPLIYPLNINYQEAGAIATDFNNNLLPVIIISIINNNNPTINILGETILNVTTNMTISSSIINISTSNRYTITYQTQDIFGNTTTINRYIYMTNFIAIPYNSTNIVYFGHTTFFNPTTIKPSYTFLLEDLTNRNPPLPDITGTFSEDMIILNSPDFMINPTFLIIKDLIPHQYL